MNPIEDDDDQIDDALRKARRMDRRTHLLAAVGAGILSAVCAPAAADVIQKLRFSQPAKALVWSSTDKLSVGGETNALFGGGDLDPAGVPLDFTLVSETLSIARFRVASNAPISIDARWTGRLETDDPFATAIRLRHSAIGAASQPAHSGGADSGYALGLSLADLSAGARLFFGDRRTAKSPGQPEDQSVEFQIEFEGPAAAEARHVQYTVSLR